MKKSYCDMVMSVATLKDKDFGHEKDTKLQQVRLT